MARKQRFLYPLEGKVFETLRIKKIGGKWVREVAPTKEYAWSEADVRILELAYRCTVREHAGIVTRECEELDWSRVEEAARRVENAVKRWLEALKKEYVPTNEHILSGTVWRHKKRNLYIVPLYPWRYVGFIIEEK